MTTEPIDTDERRARLERMRAEFRAAQQRRDERLRHAVIEDVTVTEPVSVVECEP